MERKNKQLGVLMNVETFFDNVKLIELNKFDDNRGWFLQSYDEKITDLLKINFVQENISFSRFGVARGLHYQWEKPMGKLIQCLNGKIIDIIVDIRKDSKTLGESKFFILDKPEKLLWVPHGYAHGFISMHNDSIVKYMCDNYYNKENESGINILDNDLQIKQKLKINIDNIILSDKDRNAQSFFSYLKEPKF
jgi:dTDP-4-dehydrorhamnose 3,5-epimerase